MQTEYFMVMFSFTFSFLCSVSFVSMIYLVSVPVVVDLITHLSLVLLVISSCVFKPLFPLVLCSVLFMFVWLCYYYYSAISSIFPSLIVNRSLLWYSPSSCYNYCQQHVLQKTEQ